MKVKVIKESGYIEAMQGLALSYNISLDRAVKVAIKLCNKDGGENKFLESIMVWFDITAPRFWWQEADTYRLSTKQSQSTMHTLRKRELTQFDFEYNIYEDYLVILNRLLRSEFSTLAEIKNALPEGFLQRRIWCMSYKTLRNIILQRHNHKLPQWHYFINEVKSQIRYFELLPLEEKQVEI